jgi:cytochrome c oxidase cbb3-type subunit III
MISFKRTGLIVGCVAALLVAIVFLILPAQAQEEIDVEKLTRGAEIYHENCALCHGANGEGRIGATLSKDWPSIRPDLTVKTTIANGISGSTMPAWSQTNGGPLTDEQIEDVTYYILSWQSSGVPQVNFGPTSTPRPPLEPIPGVVGDPNRGAVLYDENCAVCHGANGEGRSGANLSDSWASIRADLTVKTTISNGISGSTMPAWAQANGGPLTETDINDITSFVLTLDTGVSAPEPTQSPADIQLGLSWLIWLAVLVGIVLVGVFFSRRNQ